MPAKDLLVARNVHKSYGRTEVLKGIDLTVAEGQVVALIGASGSGKTTFLRCINLLEDFQQGSITVDGDPVGYVDDGGRRKRISENRLAAQRARIGMVFQSFNLFPHMTAAENVMLGLVKVKRLAKAEARSIAEHWLGRVGLAERSDHYPYQLSGARKSVVEGKSVSVREDLGGSRLLKKKITQAIKMNKKL